MYLEGIRSVAVMCTLNVCSVCTKNGHQILCTDDMITAMNGAVNIDSVNQHDQISIKYFLIEFNYVYYRVKLLNGMRVCLETKI